MRGLILALAHASLLGMNYSHHAPYASTPEDKLPQEIIFSIEQILDLGHGQLADPLDRLTNDFTPVSVLNEYFPDGKCLILPLY